MSYFVSGFLPLRLRRALVALAAVDVLCALVLPALVHAGEAPLTLSDAQRYAVARSRQLVAEDAAVSASRDMAVVAGQLPDPTLKFGLDGLPVTGPNLFSLTADSFTMRRIGLAQEYIREEKRQLRAQRFEREAERSLAEQTVTLAMIQRDTALAWLDRYYAEAAAAVVAEQINEAHLEIEVAEAAYRAGRGGQADVFTARLALGTLEDRLSESQRRIRTAKTALARWVGERADAPLGGTPAIDSIRLDPHSLDTELAHHPQITVLGKQEEIAATEARLAQANKKADWTVEVAYGARGPTFSNLFSVGVSIPMQWDQKNRQDRELAAKLAIADEAAARREEALRAHVGEVRAQIEEWENGRERRVRYERELVPLAKERTQAALAAYRGGKGSLTEVLLARRSEIDVRMEALQLESDTARLWAQLNFLFPDRHVTRQSEESR